MAMLFRYELKKMLSRKMIWIVFVLSLVIVATGDRLITDKRGGRVQGMKDIYSMYEGRILTDELVNQMKAALNQYVSDHPDDFESFDSEGEEGPSYFPVGWSDYSSGVWTAYTDIYQDETVESRAEVTAFFQRCLDSGRYDDGTPLTLAERQSYQRTIILNQHPPLIHYTEGWRILFDYSLDVSFYLYLLLALGLLPLFSGETTAKMEDIMLCTVKRKKAITVKLLVSVCYALLLTILFQGLQTLLVALTYGLDGGTLPLSVVAKWMDIYDYDAGLLVYQVFLRAVPILLASGIACALIISLASSLFRHPLTSLIASVAFITVQFIPIALMRNDSRYSIKIADTHLRSSIEHCFQLLPAAAFANIRDVIASMSSWHYFYFGLGLTLLSIALLAWLIPHSFLKQRRV